jgi:hypothetical protein
VTAAVGWAVVGPQGVVMDTMETTKWKVAVNAHVHGYFKADSTALRPGYRLARVRIEVIEESDDARGENDGR